MDILVILAVVAVIISGIARRKAAEEKRRQQSGAAPPPVQRTEVRLFPDEAFGAPAQPAPRYADPFAAAYGNAPAPVNPAPAQPVQPAFPAEAFGAPAQPAPRYADPFAAAYGNAPAPVNPAPAQPVQPAFPAEAFGAPAQPAFAVGGNEDPFVCDEGHGSHEGMTSNDAYIAREREKQNVFAARNMPARQASTRPASISAQKPKKAPRAPEPAHISAEEEDLLVSIESMTHEDIVKGVIFSEILKRPVRDAYGRRIS